MSLFSYLAPDATLLLFTTGILLLYVEINRPGLILPGAVGLTVTLLALAHALRAGLPPRAAAAGLLATALLALSTRARPRLLLAVIASGALFYAFCNAVPISGRDLRHICLPIVCAVVLGPGTFLLTTIAARARQNKGLDSK